MIAIGYLLKAIGGGLHNIILPFFYFLMLARCVLSFVNPDPRNQIVQFIYSTTEPMLSIVRERMPRFGMLDLSPLVWFLIFYLLDSFLAASLCSYGNQFLIQGGESPSPC